MNSMAMNSARQQIGAAVRAEVRRRGRSAASVARTLGLSKSSVYRRYTGETPITLNEICALAPHLGMDAADLVIAAKPTEVHQ